MVITRHTRKPMNVSLYQYFYYMYLACLYKKTKKHSQVLFFSADITKSNNLPLLYRKIENSTGLLASLAC